MLLQLLKSQAAKIAVDKGQRVLAEFNELVPTLRGSVWGSATYR
jgi:hypothetical protein